MSPPEFSSDILDYSDDGSDEWQWVVVQEVDGDDANKENNNDMTGVSLLIQSSTNETKALSTRKRRDAQRWKVMPSLAKYPLLQKLDLYNSRYITHLHDSVGDLRDLQKLVLTRCWALERLPSSLGNLEKLQEVRETLSDQNPVLRGPHDVFFHCVLCFQLILTDSMRINALPDSIGKLKQ